MRRISIYLLSLMLSGVFFIACDKDDVQKLTFDKDNIEMIVGEEVVVLVSGGEAPYTATPANETIAEATIDGSNITIKGMKEGNTTVKVTDKNGTNAVIAVTVKVDPFEGEKEDAALRVKWDTYEKTAATDGGTFTLTKDENKTVTFSWTNEEENESLLLTFEDSGDKLGEKLDTDAKAALKANILPPAGKLTVTVGEESDDYDVTSWRLVQAKPADDEEGTPNTYWIAFTANGKSGICVLPLTVEVE